MHIFKETTTGDESWAVSPAWERRQSQYINLTYFNGQLGRSENDIIIPLKKGFILQSKGARFKVHSNNPMGECYK